MPTEDDKILPEKSKTQKKREAEALQALGIKLTQLSDEQLHQVPLPDNLMDAILAARKINQHGGLKRQLQYIGKLMRDIDPLPVQRALDQFQLQHQRSNMQFHQLENWRDQLIQNSSQTLEDIASRFPGLDRQHLRQLVRNAQDNTNEQKSKKASRKLFQYLKDLSGQDAS